MEKKIINISNVRKWFGIAKIATFSVLPHKDLELQKCAVETNNYLKDLYGFYSFLFIKNSNITENYLHHDEIHLTKVGSFLLGQNFVSHFNKSFWHHENVSIKSNLQIVNSGNCLLPRNRDHVGVSDTKDIVFINDENILYNLSSSLMTVFGNLNNNVINHKFEQLK